MKNPRNCQIIYHGKADNFGSSSSVAYWQAQDTESRLNAVWELVLTAWKLKGNNPDELRFQRSVALLKRI